MELKSLKSVYQTDPKAEEEGVEVHIGDGFFVRVARANNRRASRMFEEFAADPQNDVKRKAGLKFDSEEFAKFLLRVKSTAILVGWRGLTDNGVEVPYSPEKAAELLQMSDFAARIDAISSTQENYRVEAIEAAKQTLGNA